jgi:hypothetical protein
MPTFLVNSRMHPKLSSRIKHSVSGKRTPYVATARSAAHAEAPSSIPWSMDGAGPRRSGVSAATRRTFVRALLFACLGGIISLVIVERRARQRTLDEARIQLQTQLDAAHAKIPQAGWQIPGIAQAWIGEEAAAYAGDFTAPELTLNGALARRAKDGGLYVRLSTEATATKAELQRAIAESPLDAFAACWVAPPSADSENSLLGHLRARPAPFAEGVDPQGSSLLRLHAATFVVDLLSSDLRQRTTQAETLPALEQISRLWQAARVEEHLAATHARTLLLLLDEPKVPGSPVELDGTSDHFARVVWLDLAERKVLLRRREHVRVDWISERRRAMHSANLTGCKLAYDVLGHTDKAPSTGR